MQRLSCLDTWQHNLLDNKNWCTIMGVRVTFSKFAFLHHVLSIQTTCIPWGNLSSRVPGSTAPMIPMVWVCQLGKVWWPIQSSHVQKLFLPWMTWYCVFAQLQEVKTHCIYPKMYQNHPDHSYWIPAITSDTRASTSDSSVVWEAEHSPVKALRPQRMKNLRFVHEQLHMLLRF